MSKEENLQPFKPGESGNPNGRPVGSKNRSTIARKVLEMRALLPKAKFDKLKESYPDIMDNMTVEEIMTIVQASNAIAKADTFSYNAVMDSAYGKPKQDIDANIQGNIILQVSNDDLKLGE